MNSQAKRKFADGSEHLDYVPRRRTMTNCRFFYQGLMPIFDLGALFGRNEEMLDI